MTQTTLKIEGMMCSMCQAHINDIIRKTFAIEKVSSSHSKGETVIISANSLDKAALKKAIEGMGYRLLSCTEVLCEVKPKFHLFGKKA